jgi:RNA polymerase sigma-70 factor (ECF subfamily)
MHDFGDFYTSTRDGVFRAVLAATGDRVGAEDAVAEAYARAFARWSRLDSHPNLTGWVVLTALNVRRSWWRRLRRELLGAPPPDTAVAPAEDPPDRHLRVRAAVAGLPRRQREVLALRVLAGLRAEETGQTLGISAATVHVHLHRALSALRAALNDAETTTSDTTKAEEGAR